MDIRRNILPKAALAVLISLSADAIPAHAGEKIIFSGRDGRQSRYHRSLNARPLFVAPRLEKRLGNGESPMDAFNAAPVMMLETRRPGGKADDKDWIFKSPEELGSEGIKKDMAGEDEEFEKDGIRRTSAERYLDRKREKSLAGDDSKATPEKISEMVKELDEDPLLAEMKAYRLASPALNEPRSAVDLANENRVGNGDARAFAGQEGVFRGSQAGASFGGKASVEYQREHISKLKQSLGVSTAIGARAGGGGNAAAGLVGNDVTAPLAGAPGSFGRPSPGIPGAYPGSQGLGLKELTSPASRIDLTPLPGAAMDPSARSQERYRPSRLEQPKRKMY